MFGFCRKEGYLCLVTEFVKGGNLHQIIHDKTIPLHLYLEVEVLLAICRGMVYLHNKKIIHVSQIVVDDFFKVGEINMLFIFL